MVKITPQCIAYAAVQVARSQLLRYCISDDFTQARFALSDTVEWGQSENLFKFDDFYHAIVDLFREEDPWSDEILKFHTNLLK